MKKIAKRILTLLIAATMLFGIVMPGITSDSFAPLFIEASAAGASPAITSQETYCNNNPNFSQCYQGIRLKWSAVSGASYYSLYIYQFDDFYSSSYTMNTLAFSINCSTNSFDSASLSEAKYLETRNIWGGGTLPGYYVLVIPRDSSGNYLCSSYTFTNLTSSVGVYFPHMLYFYTNDGTNTLFYKTSSLCHNGVIMSEWASLPTRKGYTLVGWSKNQYSTTAEYSINDKFSCGHGDAYFYAIWSPISYTVKYNANGGTGSMSSSSHKYDEYKYLNTNSFSKSGYYFLGWSTSSSATSATYIDGQSVVNLTSTNGGVVNLYAVWSKIPTYTVSYNANGGTGAPSSQTKTKDVTLWLSSVKPTKSYTITYNANGGSVSSSSKTVNCTFKNWNTAQNGSGTSYSAGASYTTNGNATLYAQWTNPTAGTLATPTRTGYTFDGWYTAASGGTKVTSSSTVSSNVTLYAHWAENNVYNLGEETYSFDNYFDGDSSGHCFGMSVTSSGYYTGELDINSIGISDCKNLYTVELSSTTAAPICHYQSIQGSVRNKAIVAGVKPFVKNYFDIDADWKDTVNYVKNHNYDNKGTLQVISIVEEEGGHAMNFLYYKNVDGQDRIYVYDNNYPNIETYFYKNSAGEIKQYPKSTFYGSLDSIGLLDVNKYLKNADSVDFTHVIYAYEGEISINGVKGYPMLASSNEKTQYMYEIPANMNEITIKPLVDNAEFTYLDKEYSFGAADDLTTGKLKLATLTGSGDASFTITNGKTVRAVEIRTPSTTSITYGDSIILHADIDGTLPAGWRIDWSASNGNFAFSESADGTTCTITPNASGNTEFTATVYDAQGNAVSTDEQTMTSKAGFFQKIIAFFKSIFGLNKVFPELIRKSMK